VAVYNLESLKKIHDGTLNPARRRDIRAGLPFFTQYVRHDQPEVMAAFLEEILIDARQAGGVQAEREVYWRTIKQIGDQANWAGRSKPKTGFWIDIWAKLCVFHFTHKKTFRSEKKKFAPTWNGAALTNRTFLNWEEKAN
jgi:hypothetical protein